MHQSQNQNHYNSWSCLKNIKHSSELMSEWNETQFPFPIYLCDRDSF